MRFARLAALVVLSGCSSTTGVVLRVSGGDTLGGDRLQVIGSVDGMTIHDAMVPADGPRALAHTEDLRILFSDDLAGRIIAVQATVLHKGRCVAAQTGYALLVLHLPKAIELTFAAPGGCSTSGDGGSPADGGADAAR